MTARLGGTALPGKRARALERAKRLEWISLGYLATCVVIVYLVMGNSQAMKVAWIEDLLSLIPPIAFLLAIRHARKKADRIHPYGHHRAAASGHLASAVALLAMGVFLVLDSGSGLLAGEHPTIGTMRILGHTVWAGWPMIAAMVYTGVGPVILGRLKLPLSEALHDKVLYADAEMNKADWQTAGAAIVGVLGIGIGLWWADSAAALLIAVSILKDGVSGVRAAIRDLADTRVRTHDDSEPHPLIAQAEEVLRGQTWVAEGAVRIRDLGHVFHAEAFVVPHRPRRVDVALLEEAREALEGLDWKMADVVVIPVREIPRALRG
ncbi:MAG: cation diffusion facilitator family transporter [bacterium]|nr:cation diffusion facilitator family transporter [bacterium]